MCVAVQLVANLQLLQCVRLCVVCVCKNKCQFQKTLVVVNVKHELNGYLIAFTFS